MRSLALSFLLSVAGISVFVWILGHIGLGNITRALYGFPWWGIFVVIFFTFLNFAIGIVRWQRILRHQGVAVGIGRIWGAWLAGFSFSYVTPISYIGGEAVRTGFLRSRLGVPFAKGFSSIAIDKILEGTVWLAVIASGTVIFLLILGAPALGIARALLIGGSVVLGASALIAFVYILGFRRERVVHRVLRFFKLERSNGGVFLREVEHEVLGFFHVSNRALWEGLGITLMKNAVLWARMLFIVVLLGKGTQLWEAFVMLASSYVGHSAPVPGGLGTFEISQSFIFASLGLGAGAGVALALLIRASEIIFVVAGGVFLVRFGVEFFMENVKKLAKW